MTTVVVVRRRGTVAIATESSQLTASIADDGGIDDVHAYRGVFEFERFRGIGTGRAFALRARVASDDQSNMAREIAEPGCRAGCEFDKNSAVPIQVQTFKPSTRKD